MEDYNLTRSRRKTLALIIRNGRLEIRAPLRMPIYEVNKFVTSKEKWIRDKLARSTEQQLKRGKFRLGYGAALTYRGKQYPITAKEGSYSGFDGERFFIPPGLDSEQIKSACGQVYHMLAKRVIPERTRDLARQMGVRPAAIRINSAKTRWGSCSAKRSVNFSWRLILADDGVIDYVIVHELAHITEMNHSQRFWRIVSEIIPDYKERKTRLKGLQEKLNEENW